MKIVAFRSLPAKKKKGVVVDKPVTFHSRIKSSGYGSKPGKAVRGLWVGDFAVD